MNGSLPSRVDGCLFFFFFLILYWSIVDLQWFVIAK